MARSLLKILRANLGREMRRHAQGLPRHSRIL